MDTKIACTLAGLAGGFLLVGQMKASQAHLLRGQRAHVRLMQPDKLLHTRHRLRRYLLGHPQ